MARIVETADAIDVCEIEDCGHAAMAGMNGIQVCERCRQGFCSRGFGAVYFGGRWHGVIGADILIEDDGSGNGEPNWTERV